MSEVHLCDGRGRTAWTPAARAPRLQVAQRRAGERDLVRPPRRSSPASLAAQMRTVSRAPECRASTARHPPAGRAGRHRGRLGPPASRQTRCSLVDVPAGAEPIATGLGVGGGHFPGPGVTAPGTRSRRTSGSSVLRPCTRDGGARCGRSVNPPADKGAVQLTAVNPWNPAEPAQGPAGASHIGAAGRAAGSHPAGRFADRSRHGRPRAHDHGGWFRTGPTAGGRAAWPAAG
jgi:hypothetical protein